jgi:hypothetical protein
MPGPAIAFGFVLATLYGALFHVLSGGDARRLALFLLASWVGFALGHITGDLLDVEFLDMGTINMLNALAGSLGALFLVQIFTRAG